MKDLVKKIVSIALRPLPIFFTQSFAGVRLIAPFYHIVSDRPPEYLAPLSYRIKSPKEFEKELDLLLSWLRPVSLEELHKTHSDGKKTQPGFFLSFDDGLREVAEIAAPILLRKGVPATMFLNSAFIDNRELCFELKAALIVERLKQIDRKLFSAVSFMLAQMGWDGRKVTPNLYACQRQLDKLGVFLELDWSSILSKQSPYMTSNQVQDLLSKGFMIGSHSIDHPVYKNLSFEEQVRQTMESMEFICNRFNLDYRAFAFPYGDFGVNKRFFNAVLQDGIVDMCFGTRGLIPDEFEGGCIQRLGFEAHSGTVQDHLRNQYSEKIIRRFACTDCVRRRP